MTEETRKATAEDIDTLVKVRFDYFAAENWKVSAEQGALIEANLRSFYAKHLNDDFFAFLTEVDHQVVSAAFLGIEYRPANLSHFTGKTGTVYNVLTYPEHRRRGCATRTMRALIDEALEQELSYITLAASASGKPLYRKLGFQELIPTVFTDMKLTLG